MTGRLIPLALGAVMLAAACSKVIGLPEVPPSVTRIDAGLESLATFSDESRAIARPLSSAERSRFASAPPSDPVDRIRYAADLIASGNDAAGVVLGSGVILDRPSDLVVGNAFRMQVYRAKRAFLSSARARGDRSATLPGFLSDEPLSTLRKAAAVTPSREISVQIALAHVDRMFLDPALEIRAPASIDSVHELTRVLDHEPYYVPALVGRGLNHLNRPRKLVWPEHPAPPEDAASKDLALAAAVGAKVGGASDRVKGFLLLLLGDAYAHEGRAGLARSWWMLAGEATEDRTVHEELAERATWPEKEMPDRLEARLAARMDDVEAPVSDLSFLWDDGARGPW